MHIRHDTDLLSYQDLRNLSEGFVTDEYRYAKVTDYAKAVGVYCDKSSNGDYWLRSPSDSSGYAGAVDMDGSIKFNNVDYSSNGVRVACTINLK